MHNPVAGPTRGACGVGDSDDGVAVAEGAAGTLWVVDDSEAVLVLTRSAFERAGWRVETYEDLDSARRALALGPVPDAVLLDIHLPDGNGLDHVGAFAAAGAAVVVVSNVAGPDQVEAAFAAGAGDVVPKPFDLRSLLARVARAKRAAPPRAHVPPSSVSVAKPLLIDGAEIA